MGAKMAMLKGVLIGYSLANVVYLARGYKLYPAEKMIPAVEKLKYEAKLKAKDKKYRVIVTKKDGDVFYTKPSIFKGWNWADELETALSKEEAPLYKVTGREDLETNSKYRPATEQENKEIARLVKALDADLPF